MAISLVTVLFSFVAFQSGILAFNIATKYPTIFKGRNSSLFGFSMVLAEQDNRIWLYVGAPKGDKLSIDASSSRSFENGEGTVQLCRATQKWQTDPMTCTDIAFPKSTSSYSEMLGFSMASVPRKDSNKPEKVMFCAPMKSTRHTMLGGCAESKIGEDKNVTLISVMKATSLYKPKYFGAGFSVYSLKDGAVLYGIPGKDNWAGAIKVQKSGVEYELPSKLNDSFLGFSIYSGKFTLSSTEFIVTGSPKHNETGRVDIFNDERATIWYEKGTQLGSYFGATVCAVDINGDGCDDLLIGVPMFTGKISTEGRVNVYISRCEKRVIFSEPIVLTGSNARNARFGTAIADVGDLDKDFFNDIAIGAPFEENNVGCIYIYNGGRDGLQLKKRQRIFGKTVRNSFLGFGWYISKSADVDNNGYNDFAVSALYSDEVAILKGRPIINTFVDMDLHNVNLSVSNTINISLTFRYSTGYSFSKGLNLSYCLAIDILFRQNKRFTISETDPPASMFCGNILLQNNQTMRNNLTADLMPNVVDFLKPIQLNLSYDIHPIQLFIDELEPFISSDREILRTINFEKKCQSGSCEANLVLVMICNEEIVVNKTKKITLQIVVTNTMNDAFQTTATFKSDDKLSYYGMKNDNDIGVDCLEQRGRVECDIGNPLPGDSEVKLILQFKTPNIPLNEMNKTITIYGEVATRSEEKSKKDNRKSVLVLLKLLATPELTVKTESAPVRYKKGDTLTINGSQSFVMRTDFIIQNLGPSDLPKTKVQFVIPMALPEGSVLFTAADIKVTRKNLILRCTTDDVIASYSTTTLSRAGSTATNTTIIKPSPTINIPTKARLTKQAVVDCNDTPCHNIVCDVPEIGARDFVVFNLHLNFSNTSDALQNLDYLQITTEMRIIRVPNPFLLPWKEEPTVKVHLSFLADMVSGKAINYIWVSAASSAGALCFVMFIWFIIWKYRCCVTKKQNEIKLIKRESIKRKTMRQTSREGVQYKSLTLERSSRL